MKNLLSYILLSGNIGTGKTTLCRSLAAFFNYLPFFEPADTNPFLEDYYRDMSRWAFHSQVFFATKFAEVQRKIAEVEEQTCQDRSLFDSYVFADFLYQKNILSKREYSLLTTLLDQLISVLEKRKPRVIVYLYAPAEILYRRLKKRGYVFEQRITMEYIQDLQEAYTRRIKTIVDIPVVPIDSSQMDFHDKESVEYILHRIENAL